MGQRQSRSPRRHTRARGKESGRGDAKRILAKLLADTRRHARGMAADDVLSAEIGAAAFLSLFHPTELGSEDALDALAGEIIPALGATNDPDALALLIAAAAIGEGRAAQLAGEAVGRLRAAFTPEPIWARTVGRPAFVDAWIMTDEPEDQSNLVMSFAYGGQEPHTIVAMIDANFWGMVRMASVAGAPEPVLKVWREAAGLDAVRISAQDLADRLARGLTAFDETLDPPVDDDALLLIPLLRSRLRLLPKARQIDPPYVTQRARDLLLREFAASPEATSLGRIGRSRAANLASWFIDFACDHGAGDPVRWSPVASEILLLDWLPRKVMLDADEVPRVPDVLRAFVRFAGRRKGLPESLVGETVAAIDGFEPDYLAAMADPGRGGPASEIVTAMLRDGVDLHDPAAVQRWIAGYNAGLGPGRTN